MSVNILNIWFKLKIYYIGNIVFLSSYKNWNWYLAQDGTLQIYHNNNLCWELDCCENMSLKELNITAKKVILQYQYMMRED
mgnify:CR=1 FL=1